MLKVYPQCESSSSVTNLTSTQQSYTIWMKSLLFHLPGCTIYDSTGKVVYRIDNYHKTCRSNVFLMNLRGEVLFSLQKKKCHVFQRWNGFRWSGCEGKTKVMEPWFQVRKDGNIFSKSSCINVDLGSDRKSNGNCCRIVGLPEKSEFKIIKGDCQIVAEVRRKQSSSGVLLGDDVLSLVVEPNVDHLLIMALVTVYGLINNKL